MPEWSVRAIDVEVLDCEDEAAVVYEPFVIEAQHAIMNIKSPIYLAVPQGSLRMLIKK